MIFCHENYLKTKQQQQLKNIQKTYTSTRVFNDGSWNQQAMENPKDVPLYFELPPCVCALGPFENGVINDKSSLGTKNWQIR